MKTEYVILRWTDGLRRQAGSLVATLAFLLALSATLQAQYDYTVDNGEVTITRYTGPGSAVVIPETIAGLPVTSVGEVAFRACNTLTTVTIPNGVTEIGNGAFMSCSNLTSVTIGKSVARIGEGAFGACTRLTRVVIPDRVTNIASSSFDYCTSLTAIEVDAANPAYRSVDGVLFNKSQTALIRCPGGKIGAYIIPNSVTSVGEGAFRSCNRLASVIIPDSVTDLEGAAFHGCTGLGSIVIPNGITTVRPNVFTWCGSLTNVALPDGVTNISQGAFYGCTNLTGIVIPDRVTSIGDAAFIGCTRLTSISIPACVGNIGSGAFASCANLTGITVEPQNAVYTSVDGVLFDKNGATIIQYPGGRAGGYAIPDAIRSIEDYAFSGCLGLTSVTIPDHVTDIGDWAFADCQHLSSVAIPHGVTEVSEGLFHGCRGLVSVAIPSTVTGIEKSAFWNCCVLTSITIPKSVIRIGDRAFAYCYGLRAACFEGDAPSIADAVFSESTPTVYYLPGTTGWGPTIAGRPTTLWALPNPVLLSFGASFGVRTNLFGFMVSWATNDNLPVAVETRTDLRAPTWTPAGSVTLRQGSAYFADRDWTNYPARFYRVRSP